MSNVVPTSNNQQSIALRHQVVGYIAITRVILPEHNLTNQSQLCESVKQVNHTGNQSRRWNQSRRCYNVLILRGTRVQERCLSCEEVGFRLAFSIPNQEDRDQCHATVEPDGKPAVYGTWTQQQQGARNVVEQTQCLWIISGGNIEIGDQPMNELSHPHREPRAFVDHHHHHLTYGPVQGMTTSLLDCRSMGQSEISSMGEICLCQIDVKLCHIPTPHVQIVAPDIHLFQVNIGSGLEYTPYFCEAHALL